MSKRKSTKNKVVVKNKVKPSVFGALSSLPLPLKVIIYPVSIILGILLFPVMLVKMLISK